MSLFSPQPRLRLCTRPYYYLNALRELLSPYDKQYVVQAEEAFRSYLGCKHTIFTSMGRTAIYLGLKQVLKPGDEIIVSPMTVPEVVGMIDLVGAVPVFCDTKPTTWNMDPELIEPLITDKTRVVMTTHLYGNTDSTDAVMDICNRHGLVFLEDSAQALAARWKGKAAGTWGEYGICSFSYPKNLCTFYGGMLYTDNDTLAADVRQELSTWGEQQRKWYFSRLVSGLIKDFATMDIVYPLLVSKIIKAAYHWDIKKLKGLVEVHLAERLFHEMPPEYASQPTGFQGKLCLEQVPNLDRDARHRINAALIYHSGLKDIPQIILPPMYDDMSHTYLYYPIETPDSRELMRYMIANDRDVAYQHITNCASVPEFAKYGRDCPNAERTANSTLTLPTYPKYRLDEVERNVAIIRKFYGKGTYHAE